MNVCRINFGEPAYPQSLVTCLGEEAPNSLTGFGNIAILERPKTALFCSKACPGNRILQTYDFVQALRDRGQTIISGFHSPVEKECLRILLRGRQPVIICPARTVENMRLPADWKAALHEGRLLLLSAFGWGKDRASAALAQRRNQIVAALADEVFIAHITPGGQMENLAGKIAQWRKLRDIERA